MRPQSEYEAVLKLVEQGFNNCQIERLTGVPNRTVGRWRRGERTGRMQARGVAPCPFHGSAVLPGPTYAYLLGMYLGDGTATAVAKGVFRLEISLDARYEGIIAECAAAVEAVRRRPSGRMYSQGCIKVSSYWKHWPCVFPQHGPGFKHLRPIVLEPWQQEIVDAHPDRLLRGLIHSDGWRGTNRVKRRGKEYEYPRYQFSNRSGDIQRIFCEACDRFGVRWRQMNRYVISVASHDDVRRLDEVIGLKR